MPRLTPLESTIKKLFALSGNECAFPDCKQKLVDEDNCILCQICHISAAEPGGLRFDDNLDDEYRRSFENLILMCSNHHKKIDSSGSESKYTTEYLTKIKKEHESKYREKENNYAVDNNILKSILNSYNQQIVQNNLNGNNLNSHSGNVTFYHQNFYGLSRDDVYEIINEKTQPLIEGIITLSKDFQEEFKKPENLAFIRKTVYKFLEADESISDPHLFVKLLKEKLQEESVPSHRSLVKAATDKLSSLTKNQLLLICLIFVNNYVVWKCSEINSKSINWVRDSIITSWDFINANINNVDLEIIESYGLIVPTQLAVLDLNTYIVEKYGGLFTVSLNFENIKNINKLIFREIFMKNSEAHNEIIFNVQDIQSLISKSRKMGLDDSSVNQLVSLFKSSISQYKINTFKNSLGEEINKNFESITSYHLNTVSTYIAIIFLQYIKFPEEFDKDVWIN